MEQDNKFFVWTPELIKEFVEYVPIDEPANDTHIADFIKSKELLQVPVEVTRIFKLGGMFKGNETCDNYSFIINTKIDIEDKFPAIKSAIEFILNPEANPSNTYTEPVDTFDWQLALSGITGKVLGLRTVLLDVEITKGLTKEMSKDLSNIADEITQVLSSIKTSNLKPPQTEQPDRLAIKFIETDCLFLETNASCYEDWYYMPHWFQKIKYGIYKIYTESELPERLKEDLLQLRGAQRLRQNM